MIKVKSIENWKIIMNNGNDQDKKKKNNNNNSSNNKNNHNHINKISDMLPETWYPSLR